MYNVHELIIYNVTRCANYYKIVRFGRATSYFLLFFVIIKFFFLFLPKRTHYNDMYIHDACSIPRNSSASTTTAMTDEVYNEYIIYTYNI